jgi:hypothetical protein
MPLFIKNDIKLFFIHIPRTAGRYLVKKFEKNNFKVIHNDHSQYINNSNIPHLQYPFYNLLLGVKDVYQFTIVRNPVDRFISMCRIVSYDFNKIKTKKDFLKAMEYFRYETREQNWFIPQHKFVSDSTPYWKIENKIDNNFFKFINIKIKNKKTTYLKDELYDNNPKPVLSDEVIRHVKNYYKKDYERFNYAFK